MGTGLIEESSDSVHSILHLALLLKGAGTYWETSENVLQHTAQIIL